MLGSVKPSPVRCDWVSAEDIEIKYHDEEWGVPIKDSRALWEMLILEGFQAGLSWITILKKLPTVDVPSVRAASIRLRSMRASAG